MEVAICKGCGDAFDPEESPDGYCMNCDPEEARQKQEVVREFIAGKVDREAE